MDGTTWRTRRRASMLAAAALAATVVAVPPAGADEHDAATLGAFSAPFEEGGAAVPRCEEVDGEVVCKPTAVTSVVLPDGRVLYWNGIEGSENNEYAIVPEGGRTARDARARVLDLRGEAPAFTTPVPDAGGGTNPNIDDQPDPAGVLGVPGRPGDGLVGSTLGQVVEQQPTDPPDDSWANDADMFCTDQVHLADGRVLIAGGTDWYSEPGVPEDVPEAGGMGLAELEGLRNTRLYDATTDSFVQSGHMKYGRWYPTTVIMPDGTVFVAGGVTKLIKSTQGSQVRRTETFNPDTGDNGEWTENFTGDASENSLPLFARLHLMPNGKVFYGGVGQTFGPMGQAADEALWAIQQLWNPGTSEWEQLGPAQFGTRGGAFSVLLPLKPDAETGAYDRGTLLVGGGTLLPTPGSFAALPITEEVTVAGDEVTSERVGDLNTARWFSSAVVLPTGDVAVFNGADKDEVVAPGMEAPVRQAERYDPETREWSPLATGNRDRTYHNTAVLLPDMRVLVGGHSPISTLYGAHRDAAPGVTANNDKDPSFEIYSPPYLFQGPRPRIEKVQAAVAYGEGFRVTTGDTKPADIESIVLMRLPSLTHIVDPNQRSVELPFTAKSQGNVQVTAPPDGAVAPPGYYYLVLNRKGDDGPVPSAARIVRLDEASKITDQEKKAEAPEPMPGTEGDATVEGDAGEPDDTSVPAELAGAAGGSGEAAVLPELAPASSHRSPARAALPVLAAVAVAFATLAAAVPLRRSRARTGRPPGSGG